MFCLAGCAAELYGIRPGTSEDDVQGRFANVIRGSLKDR